MHMTVNMVVLLSFFILLILKSLYPQYFNVLWICMILNNKLLRILKNNSLQVKSFVHFCKCVFTALGMLGWCRLSRIYN